MSYQSIVSVLDERGVDLDTASEGQMRSALFEAFQRDLPLGVAYLGELAARTKASAAKILDPQDPNTALGKQITRLLGTDIARSICEAEFGVAFGLYNCCGSVAAPTRELLAMSPLEQIQLQNGALASADC
ncbi:MAG: hypothetical protein JWO40_757 [Candidatus Doudnabacteria bacterium]|nr:hypothetical protein [Candidatus Doudnabacteria bacterium]